MAGRRRRSYRKQLSSSPADSDVLSESLSPSHTDENPGDRDLQLNAPSGDADLCPACKKDELHLMVSLRKESWVRCDSCKIWYHWRCVGEGDNLDTLDKWFCQPCIEVNPTRTITRKPPARKSSRRKVQRDYVSLHQGIQSSSNKWFEMLQDKIIKPNNFRRMEGSELTLDWLNDDSNALMEPIIIEKPDGLGMSMPSDDFKVADVAEIVGYDTPVEVMDVATQSNVSGFNLAKWVEYYETEPSGREKIRNVISLEVSDTALASQIQPPRFVRELDWVQNFWPGNKRGKGHLYPKVQLYCLMSVAESWTDWHIDFAGSSVYYHILRGSKIFYFIRPTNANLAAYEKWCGTEMQTQTWLGDMVDEVIKVELKVGNTMIIPTGWIHAVFTPVDSLVFGGNFLHSYNVATQLRVREIEIVTHVPKKFQFPFFSRLCWYVGEKYLRGLKAKEEFPPRVLTSLRDLSNFLVSEARLLERGTDQMKKEIKDQIPGDRIKDAPALARELRWRVRLAADGTSDDEAESIKGHKMMTNGHGNVHLKRRRTVDNEDDFENNDSERKLKSYRPKAWQVYLTETFEKENKSMKAEKPNALTNDSEWVVQWTKSNENEGSDDVEVERKKEIMVKVRQTVTGLERQRIERICEVWNWSDISIDT